MQIITSDIQDNVFQFPDGTQFEKDIPFHGWIRVISSSKTWWFNSAFIVAIIPGGYNESQLNTLPILSRLRS